MTICSKDYLRERCKQTPEERYEQPVTSSMEYGWKLFELLPKSEMTHPAFGKTGIIKDSFYRSGGLPLKMGEDFL